MDHEVNYTVDGRNPAPVEVGGSLSHYYKVLAPSQVVIWDFFHQQYDTKPSNAPFLREILQNDHRF